MDGTKSALQITACRLIAPRLPQCIFGNLDDLAGEYAFRIGAIPAPNIHRSSHISKMPTRYFTLGLPSDLARE